MDWEVIRESLSVLYLSPFKDELSLILWCVFLGMIASLFYLTYRRQTLGKAILALRKGECTTAESAKTPEELGVKASCFQGSDRLIEKTKGEEGTLRYYLPEEAEKKANTLLKAANSKPWVIALGILGMYLLIVVIYHLLPTILEGLEWL